MIQGACCIVARPEADARARIVENSYLNFRVSHHFILSRTDFVRRAPAGDIRELTTLGGKGKSLGMTRNSSRGVRISGVSGVNSGVGGAIADITGDGERRSAAGHRDGRNDPFHGDRLTVLGTDRLGGLCSDRVPNRNGTGHGSVPMCIVLLRNQPISVNVTPSASSNFVIFFLSLGSMRAMEVPFFPARAVRPLRWV